MLVDRVGCGVCSEYKKVCSYNLGKFAIDHDRMVEAGILAPPPLDTPIETPPHRVNFPAGGAVTAAELGGAGGTAAAAAGPVVGTPEWWVQYGMYAAAMAAGGAPPVGPGVAPPVVPGAAAAGIAPPGMAMPARPPVAPPVAPNVRPGVVPPVAPPARPPAVGAGQDGPGGPMRRGRATLQSERDRANAAEGNLRAAQRQLQNGAARARVQHAETERSLARVREYTQRLYERLASGAGAGADQAGRTARDEIGEFADAFDSVADHIDQLRMAADPAEATEGWREGRRAMRRQRREQWEARDRRQRRNEPGRGGTGEGGSAAGGSGGAM